MISVVMPAYNTERFVGAAIESVLSQDMRDLELIAVDDGSTDGTHAVLEEWERRDPRVTVIRSDRNEGITAALRKGIAAARGEYVILHDSDDVSTPGRVTRQLAALEADSEAVMVTGWADLIDDNGRRVGEVRRAHSAEALTWLLHFNNVIGGLGRVMLRRDALLAAGLGETELAVDYELWRRVLRHGKLLLLPEVVLLYRVHEGGVTTRRKEQQGRDARAISRRMLDALLGRSLTDEEHGAVAAIWGGELQPGVAPVTHRVLSEIQARFTGSTEALRRVRKETARRWRRTARVLVRQGRIREALRCLWYAVRTAAAL
jgi:glycosyltransferase involved in cell wall biosynthesis